MPTCFICSVLVFYTIYYAQKTSQEVGQPTDKRYVNQEYAPVKYENKQLFKRDINIFIILSTFSLSRRSIDFKYHTCWVLVVIILSTLYENSEGVIKVNTLNEIGKNIIKE